MSRRISPEEAVKALADDAHDSRFPGTYIPMPPWDSVNFGIEYARGYSTVIAWPPTRDAVPDRWTLHLAAGLALEVHDVEGALRWVNAKNRGEVIGRYLVAVSEESGLAAVVYHAAVSSKLIDSDTDEIWIWMTQLMILTAKTAATESEEFVSSHGGRPAVEDALAALAMIALSPA